MEIPVHSQELCFHGSVDVQGTMEVLPWSVRKHSLTKRGRLHAGLDPKLQVELSESFIATSSSKLLLFCLSNDVKAPLKGSKALSKQVMEPRTSRCRAFLKAILSHHVVRDGRSVKLDGVEVVKQCQPRIHALNKLRPVVDLVCSCRHLVKRKHGNLGQVLLGFVVSHTTSVLFDLHWCASLVILRS